MIGLNKGVGKVEIELKWDPAPLGELPHDLDIIAATYTAEAPRGEPAYLVHFDSRSPDGTITLDRSSDTGQGFGPDEVLTLEFERVPETYARVVVGVAIQQRDRRLTFADIANPAVRVAEGPIELAQHDFTTVSGATAATVADFARGADGSWRFRPAVHGFDADPSAFVGLMGTVSPD